MPKKIFFILIAAALIIGLGIGGYFWWNNWSKSKKSETGKKAVEEAGSIAEKITGEATKGVLPSVGINPLESKPDVNPADKTNPFKNIKTNPFE